MAEPAQPPATAPTYTSSVIAPLQIALGAVVAAVLLVVLAALGLWPLGVAGAAVLLAVTWYLAALKFTVGPTEILVGQGRGERGLRDILVRNVVLCEVARFGWGAAFGSSPAPVSNTYVVRGGAGLRITLNDDETLNISVRDPEAAAAILRAAGVREPASGGRD